MKTDELLRAIGFKEHELPLIVCFAERREMTVEQVLRHALRHYQQQVEPAPALPPKGCGGE